MNVYILGICGTFMAGIAALARERGDRVAGADANVYPPMSDQLERLGVSLHEGYDARAMADAKPDVVIVGNAMTRGIEAVEHLLESGMRFTSGPAWLADNVLLGRPVYALAGTHGKTTTTSMLSYVFETNGLSPGFLIGGVCHEFDASARLGAAGAPFVVEADEYDSAFFDKRSKFVHYRPRVLSISSIEFDHADIFADVAAIRRQFHHVVRTVPASGLVLGLSGDKHIDATLAMGCWSELQRFGIADEAQWQVRALEPDWSRFDVLHPSEGSARVEWGLIGRHNALNAASTIACARHAGVAPRASAAALARFNGVRRRLELRGEAREVRVYDDFAHHPTAIRSTLDGLRAQADGRILAVVDLASNTMRMGVHASTLGPALDGADRAWLHAPGDYAWDVAALARDAAAPASVHAQVDDIVVDVVRQAGPGDRVLVMSNGGFGGIHARLLDALAS